MSNPPFHLQAFQFSYAAVHLSGDDALNVAMLRNAGRCLHPAAKFNWKKDFTIARLLLARSGE